MNWKILSIATLLPGAMLAQELCEGAGPFEMPPCLVGTWFGESDMAVRMQAILDSVPEHMRANMGGDMGRYLQISIYDDGYFVTSPLEGQINGAFFGDDPGDETLFSMDLTAGVSAGQMWATDFGAMGFCSEEGTGVATLGVVATNEMGRKEGMASSAAAMPGGTPNMSYICEGNSLMVFVELPDPIGTVTYDLQRVAPDRMDAETRRIIEERFAE